ncbi:MAG: phage tail tape measure protein [Deltaproteobacteria bacterium]|nr:phage tail tape measure protein [Deltaproteobacteria bacterium]
MRTLQGAITPGAEMSRALAELSTLDMSTEALENIERTALRVEMRYGTAADQIIRSSYDIQSAIAGLNHEQLGRFTEVSSMMAKGGIAQVGQITDYLGTMYGIFSREAAAMGKNAWVESVAGMTAASTQAFKTNAGKMAQAFTSLGGAGAAAGMERAEQFGLLGMLQSTMGGGEAGTKLRALLANVGRAGQALGMEFADSQGKMLPIADILDKIHTAYGPLDTLADQDKIKKAFGSEEAVALLQLMISKSAELRKHTEKLRGSGIEKVKEMADKAVTPLDKMSGGLRAIYKGSSRQLEKALSPVFEKISGYLERITAGMERFKHLGPTLAAGLIGVVALTGALGLLAIVLGTLKMLFVAFGSVVLLAKAAMWGLNLALLANPITWILVGFLAFIGALVALVYYWDEVTAAVKRFWSYLTSINIFEVLEKIYDAITGDWGKLNINSHMDMSAGRVEKRLVGDRSHLDVSQLARVAREQTTGRSGGQTNITNFNIKAQRGDASLLERARMRQAYAYGE